MVFGAVAFHEIQLGFIDYFENRLFFKPRSHREAGQNNQLNRVTCQAAAEEAPAEEAPAADASEEEGEKEA